MSVVSAFDRAPDYDRHATVQLSVAEALADRIAALALPPAPRVLEIGCGTGLLGAAMRDRLMPGDWLMTDVAPAMVVRARRRFAQHAAIRFAVLDGQAPDVAGPFDLICSSMAAQWLPDLPMAVNRWRRLLSPGGRLAFTTLATGSFDEWRHAHGDHRSGLHDYPTPDAIAGLGLEVTMMRHQVEHDGALGFLRALKGIGARTPRTDHRPLTPAQLRAAMARFEADGARASYVVATCIGEPLA